jgi:hypothetical protein
MEEKKLREYGYIYMTEEFLEIEKYKIYLFTPGYGKKRERIECQYVYF